MDKRFLTAVLLSVAFLMAWSAIAPILFPGLARKPVDPADPQAQPPAATAPTATVPDATAPPVTATSAEEPAAAPAEPVPDEVAAEAQERVVISQPNFEAVFTNRGAQLTSFVLTAYDERGGERKVDLVKPRDSGRIDFPFALVTADPRLTAAVNRGLYQVEREGDTVSFRWAGGGVEVIKRFEFTERYLFNFSVEMRGRNVPYRVILGPGLRQPSADEMADQFLTTGAGVVQQGDSLEILARADAGEFQVFEGKPDFAGLGDSYFLAVLIPTRGGSASFRAVDMPVEGEAKKKPEREIYAGVNAESGVVAGSAYFGPKEAVRLEEYGLESTLQFGVFGFIARVLLEALTWINQFTHNYGWAIIVLTIIIKILLYPLQHKSIVSMKKMQSVQPKMNAIKDRYRKAKTDPDQRQKMNMEMMALYRQEGINPMSGCLPILLQLPILWGFYSLLSRAIELRGEPFLLWIQDLSAKDPYYITPILMTATMFIQQWMTPTTADPMQRRIFLMMPLIFGWIFKEFPSGLVLYWLAQNILSIIQQGIMNRYWKEHPVTVKQKG